MRVLVTGGAGYIGSAIARRLVAEGHAVVAYDDLSTGNAAATDGVELVQGSILHPSALRGELAGHKAEAVVHCAAVASVPGSLNQPADYYRINVTGTINVLEAMRATGCHKIVFASTAAVYSHDQTMPLTEQSRLSPVTPYGDTKLTAERMIHHYAMAYDLAYTTLRFFNVAGADNQHGEARTVEEHLIPRVLAVAAGRAPSVQVNGADFITSPDGSCIRDFVHVSDVADAVGIVLDHLRIGRSDIYNVCGVQASVFDVVRIAQEVTGRKIAREIAPRRRGDPGVLTGSHAKLSERYGWQPSRSSLECIIESAWRWVRYHPEGYAA